MKEERTSDSREYMWLYLVYDRSVILYQHGKVSVNDVWPVDDYVGKQIDHLKT